MLRQADPAALLEAREFRQRDGRDKHGARRGGVNPVESRDRKILGAFRQEQDGAGIKEVGHGRIT